MSALCHPSERQSEVYTYLVTTTVLFMYYFIYTLLAVHVFIYSDYHWALYKDYSYLLEDSCF